MYKRPSWDEYFLIQAHFIGIKSSDTRRQVGAVVVDASHKIISTGYNGTPPKFDETGINFNKSSRDSDYHLEAKPKEDYVLHAELNSLLHAKRESLVGCTMYVTSSPCPNCLKMIAAVGIKRVVFAELYDQKSLSLAKDFSVTMEKMDITPESIENLSKIPILKNFFPLAGIVSDDYSEAGKSNDALVDELSKKIED